jgi:alpha-maltose-1-phosphate synthase
MKSSPDVTVSVWNRFWSEHLVQGLCRDGWNVRVLGSVKRPPSGIANYKIGWMAGLLTQLSFKLPGLREMLVESALNSYEKFAARHVDQSRCFWGWSNHHEEAFRKAKANGAKIILETGSTHVDFQLERMQREYRDRGQSCVDMIPPTRRQKIIDEYEIADRICIPSKFVRETFLQHGINEAKLYVNPFGTDLNFWSKAFEGKSASSGRPFTFVFAGQIMWRKGIAYLIDAWTKANLKGARLLLVGGLFPECASFLRQLPAGVILLGHKSPGEMREIYRECDVYLLPSLEEGLARSILEAMAAGLPVVITQETGATDLLVEHEDGWVVPSANSDALVSVFQDVVKNRDRLAEIGASAQGRVKAYSWEAYGKRAAHLLREVLPSS